MYVLRIEISNKFSILSGRYTFEWGGTRFFSASVYRVVESIRRYRIFVIGLQGKSFVAKSQGTGLQRRTP